MGKTLVAFATRYGSTGETAEAIGARLRAQGVAADVKPVRDVGSLDGYDAVVFGSPLYIGSLLKDGIAFLERNRAALEGMPVAVFALGPLSRDDDPEESRRQLDTALEKVPWLRPVASRVFVGAYDPAKLRVADKLVAVLPASPLHGVPAKDERDPAEVDAFADGLPAALGLVALR